ncbi:MAG: hypothetical protein ACLGI6_21720, partial [Gammaproteobacteria bacterium]
MKSLFIRAAVPLALALGLAACGGTATYPISGSVTGVKYEGLVIANGSDTVAVPPGATKYTLPNAIEYGNVYTVTIKSPPAHQDCVLVIGDRRVATESNTAGRLAVIDVPVLCFLKVHNVVAKLNAPAEGLVLTNGASSVTLGSTTTSATFAVEYGASYGITVLTQPKDKTCTVERGTGVMGDN